MPLVLVGAPVLPVESAVLEAGPAPLFRANNLRRWIDRLHHRGIRKKVIQVLVVGKTLRMHVAMRRVPEARFIVENVVADATVGSPTPATCEVLDEATLIARATRLAGIVRVVACDRRAIGRHAIAGVGVVGIGFL